MSSINGVSTNSDLYNSTVNSTKAASSKTASTSASGNPMKDSLDSLVSAGTITQDQESTVASALVPPRDGFDPSSASGNPVKDSLDSLVSVGTLTQDQEDSVAKAIAPPDFASFGQGGNNIPFGSTFSVTA